MKEYLKFYPNNNMTIILEEIPKPKMMLKSYTPIDMKREDKIK